MARVAKLIDEPESLCVMSLFSDSSRQESRTEQAKAPYQVSKRANSGNLDETAEAEAQVAIPETSYTASFNCLESTVELSVDFYVGSHALGDVSGLCLQLGDDRREREGNKAEDEFSGKACEERQGWGQHLENAHSKSVMCPVVEKQAYEDAKCIQDHTRPQRKRSFFLAHLDEAVPHASILFMVGLLDKTSANQLERVDSPVTEDDGQLRQQTRSVF